MIDKLYKELTPFFDIVSEKVEKDKKEFEAAKSQLEELKNAALEVQPKLEIHLAEPKVEQNTVQSVPVPTANPPFPSPVLSQNINKPEEKEAKSGMIQEEGEGVYLLNDDIQQLRNLQSIVN